MATDIAKHQPENKSHTLFSACFSWSHQSLDAQSRTIKDLEPRLENVTPNDLQVRDGTGSSNST